MRVKFTIPVRPFSINSMYYGNRKHGKTAEAREWTLQVLHTLNYQSTVDKLKELREQFDSKKHSYSIYLTAYYPKKEYENKSSEISSKTIDITNWEKPLVDIIFDPKYYEEEYPKGAPNLNVNDKYIDMMLSRKRPTNKPEPYIEVTIKLKKRLQ